MALPSPGVSNPNSIANCACFASLHAQATPAGTEMKSEAIGGQAGHVTQQAWRQAPWQAPQHAAGCLT